jgi:hypothetical protein
MTTISTGRPVICSALTCSCQRKVLLGPNRLNANLQSPGGKVGDDDVRFAPDSPLEVDDVYSARAPAERRSGCGARISKGPLPPRVKLGKSGPLIGIL